MCFVDKAVNAALVGDMQDYLSRQIYNSKILLHTIDYFFVFLLLSIIQSVHVVVQL